MVDETAGAADRLPEPGWLDDPFHRSGQRWWDGRQWTSRTRIRPDGDPDRRRAPGPSQPSARQPLRAPATARSRVPTRRVRPAPSSPTWVVIGLLVAVTLIGLLAPGAEESGVASEGYRRAAYWACADLLTQGLGPSVDVEFPGDSTASIGNQDGTWQVSGWVDVVSQPEPVTRNWRCTVVHDDGDWRGTAALE